MQIDFVAGDDARSKRAREIGQIENTDSLQARDLAKRVIVSQQTRLQHFRDLYQTSVGSKIGILGCGLVNCELNFT